MAANAEVFIKLGGAKEVNALLDKLTPEIRRTAEKAVLRAGARPVLVKSKSLIHDRTGSLQSSMAVNVKMGKDGIRTARIGPRAGFKGVWLGNQKYRKGPKKGQYRGVYAMPRHYSHMVEYGTAHSPAHSFIRAATVGAKDEVLSAMAKGLDSYLTKVAKRLARKAAM